MSKFLYGIDFGTTNSALSIYDEEKKEIVDTISIPSLIYFTEVKSLVDGESHIVGEKAIDAYLSDGMKGRFIKSIKQILSRTTFTETRIHNKRYTASDLVTLILKDLKAKADQIIGEDCQKAIIGRPVFFDDDNTMKDTLAQTRLKKAAESAGFTNVRFQFEPIGAAFAYEKTISKKERVLVADLGGGTTDFTYLILDPDKVGSKDRKNDMIASGGIYIGGDSLDSAFMWDKGTPYFGKNTLYEATPGKVLNVPKSLFANICTWDKMNFFNGLKIQKEMEEYYYYSGNDPKFKNLITLIENNLGYSLFRSIEKTKIELSDQLHSTFAYSNMEIEINENISLGQYNSIIEKDIDKIDTYLDQFMETYKINPADIDCLFLTGGTSMVSAVQNLFKSKFPHIPLNSGDNFKSVAKGLAYSGYLFED
ncbi:MULTISPECIES: Hsp70 family protein [unclassified Pedobacter]|uniref:Hsp70 family protein n=1 Tax=unclassified Pedobacter TaxID=2628915 RepID=UPI0014243688|nr:MULTISPECIES: Hsp70 family protein [unclassified Pedobacter]NII83496.1 putative chaperone protein [Pedobacter sp. SG908]NMN37360.1 putative chaperone protein [Pedobacter sp. SG918]